MKNKIIKNRYLVDKYYGKYCVKTRADSGLLFTGTISDCYAWVKLMEGGYF